MKYLPLICLLFLFGCKSNIPSESISQSIINDLNAHQQAISVLDKQTSKECKTDAFLASLNALKSQTDSIAGQIKSVNNACKVEKEVLEEKIFTRDILIMVLIGVLVLLLFFWVKFKKILSI